MTPRTVAYFSMEFGLHESLRLYSGGLGVLAGDHLRSASDLGVPLVGVSLLWRDGYFRQFIEDGRQLAAYLEKVALAAPAMSLINNVDVAMVGEPAKIKDALVRQAASPVRWVETIRRMKEVGVTRVLECGPGKVLAGLTKRIAPEIESLALADRASLAEALKC